MFISRLFAFGKGSGSPRGTDIPPKSPEELRRERAEGYKRSADAILMARYKKGKRFTTIASYLREHLIEPRGGRLGSRIA